ncbi:microsomal dipeptidase-like Zn-dependent dipeptidase [Chryseobacterium rhizosphaerae]|uniref:Microsomal dipeptidase-like Zn-dependent dipeptidase n=1 Tax=Chryseobacterium rhizosphaerae TaxID=395937 RepID=A0AAE3Y785_9FLAO|nr:membrane dipeptidase [Chryseobacterium rhizosphaerae]MDR6525239.1 microsomal dipeptidase-like Zn-dependent dipeptidase [Chryseobacterium rhizosphaerae]
MNTINIDLHCDLLYYLLNSNVSLDDKEIGCSLPYLKQGNVKLQVMAIYAGTGEGSTGYGLQQSQLFSELIKKENFFLFNDDNYQSSEKKDRVGVIASIENASAFCDENESLDSGFKKLENIIQNTQKVFYIGITHHLENRFGGGNSAEAGLKDDGKVLIDYIADRKIAIDLAHTSDQLAYDIFTYIDQKNYSIPILASHSNYRSVYKNNRNLPDELAKEVIRRKGLIGLNFIKDYVDLEQPERLYEHIQYGLDLGGADSIAYGADYFYWKDHPDTPRHPFFFPEHSNASVYPSINKEIEERFSAELVEKISHKNALQFIENMYK